jgi:hypothetical protein
MNMHVDIFLRMHTVGKNAKCNQDIVETTVINIHGRLCSWKWVPTRLCKLQKGALDSQVIKFASCLPMVGGSLRLLRFRRNMNMHVDIFLRMHTVGKNAKCNQDIVETTVINIHGRLCSWIEICTLMKDQYESGFPPGFVNYKKVRSTHKW